MTDVTSTNIKRAYRRILIADDHEALRQGVRSLLSFQQGWDVVAEAGCGREALSLANEVKPDIAIVDYGLPEMDGVQLTRSIKQDLPETRVLLYTMHDRESILQDALNAGVNGYVLKSDSASHLISAVEALSRGKAYFSPVFSTTMLDHVQDPHFRHSVVLTPRERDVVKLVAEGRTNKQIVSELGISVKTVETHRAAAMHKLNVNTTAELVLYALRNGIITV